MRSYVVRVQESPAAMSGFGTDAGGESGQLRGVIEAVATGEHQTFRSAEELVSALRCDLQRPGGVGSTALAADLDHAND